MYLSEVLRNCFMNDSHKYHVYDYSAFSDSATGSLCYMTIPVSEETFEIPVSVLPALQKLSPKYAEKEEIAMTLTHTERSAHYKSLDATVRNYLSIQNSYSRLIKIASIPDVGSYYCSFGAIYDNDLYPVMMCSWIMQKVRDEDNPDVYTLGLVKPILRVDPQVFINKGNTVERYIVNKIVPTVLSLGSVRECYNVPIRFSTMDRRYDIKVEIDKCPFRITKPVVPTIETTNDALIQVAIDHIDSNVLCQ